MCVVLYVLRYVLGVLDWIGPGQDLDWTWIVPGLEQTVCVRCVICFLLCVRCNGLNWTWTGPGLDLDWSRLCVLCYMFYVMC